MKQCFCCKTVQYFISAPIHFCCMNSRDWKNEKYLIYLPFLKINFVKCCSLFFIIEQKINKFIQSLNSLPVPVPRAFQCNCSCCKPAENSIQWRENYLNDFFLFFLATRRYGVHIISLCISSSRVAFLQSVHNIFAR